MISSSVTTPNPETQPLQQSLFLRALHKLPVSRTPVWLMRQAGRYMPEYRALRARTKDFIAMCEDPALACEITLMPIQRYQLDAAIIFSDILLIGRAMGLPLRFAAGEGPVFEPRIEHPAQVDHLSVEAALEQLAFVPQAIKLTVPELKQIPLIGFCGSPWTVATYMVEGGTTKDFQRVKTFAWSEPQAMQLLLDKLTQATIVYLKSQVAAGASALMIFDTWGGILSDAAYRRLSLQNMQQIVAALKADPCTQQTPIILFSKGKHSLYAELADSGADALSVDWTVPLNWVRDQVGNRVALQGNLDPTYLLAPPNTLKAEVKRVLDTSGYQRGHIFNLGHGILPQTDPDQVQRMLEWVQQFSEIGIKAQHETN